MEISILNIDKIIPYENNAKEHPAEQIEQIKKSIQDYGNNDPIAVDEEYIIIEGHGRCIALKELGYKEVECIILHNLTEEQKKAYRLVHNKLTMNSDFDFEKLEKELSELTAFDIDMAEFGFDESLFDDLDNENDLSEEYEETKETLAERYIIPPFSIFDARQGYWQDRKDIWKRIIKSDVGRDEGLIGSGGLKELAEKHNQNLTGTSIFDPVLCEILINWFCPVGGNIIDPFAGGSVRGLISVLLGNKYTGIDLSDKQIKANYKNYNNLKTDIDLFGNDMNKPNWICDDSKNINKIIKDKYDFLLTCPPYADLEVYSDDPRDLSNMNYADFYAAYKDIICQAAEKLNDNAFVAIVVGEVRDKNGYYYNFVGDTINACIEAGLKYYNECILINAGGTLALRAGRQFNASRKIGKTHQNVLIFLKGNEKEIDLQKYDYNFETD